MDWLLLGIEPTKDKKAITAAYRQQLRTTNPEDKPEEFKALRAAYEEALRLADQQETEPVRDESPVGLWMERVDRVYWDFRARLDPAVWTKLLQDDVCTALDTRPAAEDALLKYLMENFYLPQNIWALLDDTFHFQERVEELYESYPRDFIDHAVINGIRLDATLAYELFIPGIDAAACDTYRRLYHQALQTSTPELEPILNQMDTLSESHPYGEILRCRFLIETGREADGKAGFQKLAESYPDCPQLVLSWASMCLDEGRIEEAEAIARRILGTQPNHIGAKRILIHCLDHLGAYQDAKEYIYELLHDCDGDPIISDEAATLLRAINEKFVSQLEERFNADPDDTENAIELAWCYIQNERLDDAMELALQIDGKKAEAFAYHNLMGKLHHNRQEFEDALEHLSITVQIIRTLTPDGTKETEKRIKRLPEMLQIEGVCLMQLEKTAEAKEKFEEALQLAPEDSEVLTIMGKILYASGDYEYAAEVLERLIRITSNNWYGNMLLALVLYRLHRDRDAFDATDRAIAIQGSNLSMYILKMQILIRNNVWGEVHSILEFLENSGAPDDISIDWIKAQLTELEESDEKKAFEQYQRIARQIEAGQTLMFASELYYRMAVLMGKQMDIRKEDDRDILISILDKGLSHDECDADCLGYKAWILRKGGKLDDAIAMWRQLESKDTNSMVAIQGLAETYYQDLGRYAAQALEYYERLLQRRQAADLYFYAATCKRYLGDLEDAWRYFMKEIELDPDDVDGYNGLALICDARGDFKESVSWLEQAIKIMEQHEQTYFWLIEHQVQALRRLGNYEQALAVTDRTMQRYDYPAGFQLKFDICCQFGLWERAKQVLDSWKKASRNDPDLMAATGRLHLLTGKMFQAAFAMGPAKHKLPFEQVQDFRLQLADLECNFARQVQIWSRRATQEPNNDYAFMNLACAYWRSGNKDAARQAAQKALALLDDILTRNLTDEALYRSRRCQMLAILGKENEARRELEIVRNLPLCQHCEYGKCKDADIYEAAIEEILGNKEKALMLYRAGKEKWFDDLDFAAGEARLRRKGK